jgi:hypothetical protein
MASVSPAVVVGVFEETRPFRRVIAHRAPGCRAMLTIDSDVKYGAVAAGGHQLNE